MKHQINNLHINSTRLNDLLCQFAKFGKTAGGGVTRLAASDEDKLARDLLVKIVTQAECKVTIDAIGNIFIRRQTSLSNLDPVMIGSHGDSQPQGGRFDGIYGVLAGLEVILSLNDHNISTKRPIELVMWTNEEGSRFTPSMLGSSVFAGLLPLHDALNKADANGIKLGDELKRIGYAGLNHITHYPIYAAIELHIEQGPVLEQENKLIGVVTGAMGQKWYQVTLEGLAGHAGTVPLDLRRDATLGVAKAIIAINQIGKKYDPNARATVGRIDVEPNSSNVIAGKVTFSVEFRHPCSDALDGMEQDLKQALSKIADENSLVLTLTKTVDFAPLNFDARLIQVIKDVATKLNYTQQEIVSGAGHDSCPLNKIAPTAMIFIPCIAGISHNEQEDITDKWSEAGGNMLLHTVLQLANET